MFIERYLQSIIVGVVILIVSYLGYRYHKMTVELVEKDLALSKIKNEYKEERLKLAEAINKQNQLEEKIRKLSSVITSEEEDNLTKRLSLLESVKDSLSVPVEIDFPKTTINVNATKMDNMDKIYFMYENATGKRL
jgi:flagellar biosynthesis chaperone FliJ